MKTIKNYKGKRKKKQNLMDDLQLGIEEQNYLLNKKQVDYIICSEYDDHVIGLPYKKEKDIYWWNDDKLSFKNFEVAKKFCDMLGCKIEIWR